MKTDLQMKQKKAYAFLWEQCTKAMKNKIESNSKFESIIKNDPIELLKIIKQHVLNYHEHRYEMAIMFESL
jgi:hypothetical protein